MWTRCSISGKWRDGRTERSVVFMILSVAEAQYCSGDKIEKNEMGGACSAYGGEERRIQGFGGET